jgi:ribosomal-protein-alanine N-acetyltransferase
MSDGGAFAEFPTLETDRLLLRKITRDDAPAVFDYASDPQVPLYMPWLPHQSLAETYAYLAQVIDHYAQGEPGPWGIVHKGDARLIGACGYSNWRREHRRAEIGYVLHRGYWGHGYMTEAVRAIVDFGFARMGLNRVEARCEVPNVGSARVMEKVGMTFEGILREQVYEKDRYRDMKIYALLRRDWASISGR